MKNKFLHIFLSNNLVTAYYMSENDIVEVVCSDVHLSSLEKLLDCLKAYHQLPFRLIMDNSTISIKTFDILGINQWNRYLLRQRLQQESLSSDWHSMWEENTKLILVRGKFSDFERAFFQKLLERNYLVESTLSALWVLNNILLKGHQVKESGIIQIPLRGAFQHVLYLNGVPSVARISKDTNANDWIEFVHSKYKITLDTLDAGRLITSLGNSTDSFASYVLTRSITKAPAITFTEKFNVHRYYAYTLILKQFSYGITALSIAFIVLMVSSLIRMNNQQNQLDTLIQQEQQLLNTLPIDETAVLKAKSYVAKHQLLEKFNLLTFPSMLFLEKISAILPNYGQVVYVRISPKKQTASPKDRDEFSVHFRLRPFKSAKNLQSLTTELHKAFGSELRIHIIQNPKLSKDLSSATPLKNTIQINITGFIHELPNLKP